MGASTLLLIALGAFGLSTVVSRTPTIVLVLVGGLCLWIATRREDPADGAEPVRWVFGLLALFGVLTIVGPPQVLGDPPSWFYLAAGFTWLVLGFAWLVGRANTTARRAIFLLVLVATTAMGVVQITSAAGVGFDVLLLHEAAAEAISSGESPYAKAVMVPNGAPEGEPFIVGYPYPPVTALAYSAGEWAFGDPRWTSLIGWLVVLAVIGARSWRASKDGMPLGTMLVAASIPGWPLMLTSGWTESLSLALLAIAVLVWSRSSVSGLMSGVFVGSKQYLLAVTPLFAANRLTDRWLRATWAVAGFAVAFVPILFWGVPDFVNAAVRFHLEAPARPDGSSIVGLTSMLGLTWAPPVWVMVAGVAIVTFALWRHTTDLSRWLSAMGVLLVVTLFLSGQAFTNYWFLVAGVTALAIIARPVTLNSPTRSESGQPIETQNNELVE